MLMVLKLPCTPQDPAPWEAWRAAEGWRARLWERWCGRFRRLEE